MKNNKFTLRLISIILTFSMILTSLPISVTAETDTLTEEPILDTTETSEIKEATIIEEIEEKREPNVKHFLLSDGTYTAAVYDEDVHVLEEDGSYSEIDNSLIDDGSDLKAKNGKNDIKLSNNTNSSKLVKMNIGGYKLSWNFEDINKTKSAKIKNKETKELTGDEKHLTITNNKGYAYFENAFDNVDLEYIIGTNSVKENIILKQKGAKSTYIVNYNIDNLTAVQTDSKTITLYDGENPVFTLSAPVMTDSVGESSNDLTLTLVEQNNKKLKVQITANEDWLNSDDRVYPVTLDPVAVFMLGATNISYKYSYTNTSVTESAPGTLYVGYSLGYTGTNCSAVKLNTLPTLSNGDMIYKAQIMLYLNEFQHGTSNSGGFINVDLHEITSAWSGFSASTIYVKGNTPVSSSTVIDYQKASAALEDKHATWDITALVKKWYSNSATNKGFVLKASNMVTTDDNIAWYANPANTSNGDYYKSPAFAIYYLNHKGIENYWSFTNFTAGTGSAYVNNYTGNLVYSVPVISTTSENMPASVVLTYNSIQSGHFPNSICGAGFRTNYDIKVSYLTPGVGLNDELQALDYYYTIEDADGTVHYMKSVDGHTGGTHKDEDGLGWTLAYCSTGDPYVLTDKDNNKWHFNNRGRLVGIYSNQSSDHITLTYDSTGYVLQSVTDGAGNTLTFTRNQYNAILNIADEFGRKVYFSYSNAGLKKITYYDGTSVNMVYDSSYKMTEIVSPDDTAIGISYISSGEANEKHRVSQVTEYSAKDENGARTSQNSLTFAYNKDNTTNITNSLNETTTYVFDNLGRQISAYSNEYGASSSSWQSLGTDATINDANYKNNKLLASYSAEKLTANHIWNHSFEANVLAGMTNTTNDGTNHYVLTTEEKYYGSQSVKVNHTSASTSDSITQTVENLTAGTYTYSAYVKASNIVGNGGGYIKATYVDANGVSQTVKSEYIKTTNGWQRVNIKLDNVAAGSVNITLGFENATGTVYFDCLQLEEGLLDDYNLAENSVFLRSNNWYSGAIYSIGTPTAGAPSYLTKSAKIYGDGLNYKHISHTSYVGQSAENLAINISVYARANSVNTEKDSTRYFGVKYTIFYTDNTSQSGGQQFNTHSDAWQYWSILAMPTAANKAKTISKITVYLTYNNNRNYAEWSGLSVKVDKTAATFSYDSKGNPISANTAGGLEGTSDFDSTTNRLLTSSDEIDGNYTYTYYDESEATKYRLKSATQTGLNQIYNFEYNSHGQATKVTQGAANSTGTIYQSSATYSTDGEKLLSAESVSGSNTSYTYDAYNRPSTVTTNGVAVNYTYDNGNRVTNINALRDSNNANSIIANSYGYDSIGRLSTITHNGFNYSLSYDNFGRQSAVYVGNQQLAGYYYDSYGRLLRTSYGNGFESSNSYDNKGRLIAQQIGTQRSIAYGYNEAGRLGSITTTLPNFSIFTSFEYDILGRLINANKNISGFGQVYYNYGYNNKNQLVSLAYNINGVTHGAEYAYTYSNIGTLTTFNNGVKVNKTLNHLAATNSKMVINTNNRGLKVSYTYKEDSSRNYGLVESYRYSIGTVTDATNNTISNPVNDSVYTYTYDANGNITEIKCDGYLMYRYHYDDLGQLIRIDDTETVETSLYEYDAGGNIISHKIANELSLEDDISDLTFRVVNTYTYGNNNWKDLLTAYNGNTITYDAIGNPLTYKNGEQFTWQGRSLYTITKGSQTITNLYNEDGIRVKKTVVDSSNGTSKEVNYILDGNQIVAIQDGDNLYRFYYDVDGVRTAMEYNGNIYYYQYNLQGDVTGLYDSNFNLVVTYLYDAYGYNYSINSYETIGNINPFRYRGYLYDEETGFYYLNSRYYDPETGRFINADGFVSTGQGLNGNNMFSYCGNNPVNRKDTTGQFWATALAIIVVTICTAILSGCSANVKKEPDPYSNQANCYAYAMKLENDPRTGRPFTSKPQPGDFSGNGLTGKDLMGSSETVKKAINTRVLADAKVLNLNYTEVNSADHVAKSGNWVVALVYATDGTDYHWYRRNDDGTWSHKPGSTPIISWDASGHTITDPATCNRGIYDGFLGYYEVGPN